MIEHHHHPDHAHEETEGCACCVQSQKTSAVLPLSVIAGAILISASVLYTGSLSLKQLSSYQDSLKGYAVSAGSQNQQQAQAQAAPQAATGPVAISDRADEPVLGNKDAKVTMVEFADFQCPFCQSYFKQTLGQIKSQYIDTGKVKYVFRHFPLPFHVNAQISAVAAECANQQGKFWQYHDLLYQNGQADGTNLDKASLEKYANQLGLNTGTLGFGKNKFNQCLESNATLSIVQADTQEGTKDGVTGTPTLYINGKQIVGAQPFAQFKQALDTALK